MVQIQNSIQLCADELTRSAAALDRLMTVYIFQVFYVTLVA